VLFDCDGVLVDSTRDGERAWSRWAGEYGVDPERLLDRIHGRRSAETVSLFLPPAARAEALRRIESLEIEGAAHTPAVPGAPQLLDSLPRNWAVVTSASKALLRARLRAARIPAAPVVVTADDVTSGKPSPEGYLRAASDLGLAMTDCVVVEDSAAGVRAGYAAGAFDVLGVGRSALDTEARTVVRDLSGIRWVSGALRVPRELLLRTPA
jgi:mannitol-1-/sugar-/sorbitol-6-phosphatase